MSYIQQLQTWYAQEKAEGRVVDIKFFPGIESQEQTAKAVLETLNGTRASTKIDAVDY